MDKIGKMEKIITKGKWHFVLWRGVVGWGITTAILFKLIMFFLEGRPFTDALLTAFIMFPTGGILFGLTMWFVMKRNYDKSQTKLN
jgi:hypothetical protein